MNESEYQRLLLLEAPKRLQDVRLFRRNVGAVKVAITEDKTRWTRFGIPGQADLYCLVRGGKIIECEVKKLGGRLSKEQEAWRDFCQSWSVPWLLLKPLKDEATDATIARWIGEIAALCSLKR